MNLFKQPVWTLIVLLLFVSCRTINMGDEPRQLNKVPAEVDAKYAKLWPNVSETSKLVKEKKRYTTTQYTLEFVHRDGETKPVTIEYYQTKKDKGPRPTFTVLPITGGSYDLSRFFARWLARRGYNAAVVFRPEKWFGKGQTMVKLEKLFHRSIIEQRSVLEWLRHRPEVDETRMGTIGTSLGAFASVIVAALEPTLRVNFVIMGGQNAPEIFPITKEEGVVKWRDRRLAANSMSVDQFREHAKKTFKTDPMYFSKYVDPTRVVQVITTKDKHVPTKYQWELWESMQRPKAHVFRIGHYSSVVYIAAILNRMRRQIKRSMKEKLGL